MEEFFISIIEQSHSADMAEAEFKRALVDDPELRREYRNYCREIGTPERRAFLDFCQQYFEEKNSVWQTLNDFDDQE